MLRCPAAPSAGCPARTRGHPTPKHPPFPHARQSRTSHDPAGTAGRRTRPQTPAGAHPGSGRSCCLGSSRGTSSPGTSTRPGRRPPTVAATPAAPRASTPPARAMPTRRQPPTPPARRQPPAPHQRQPPNRRRPRAQSAHPRPPPAHQTTPPPRHSNSQHHPPHANLIPPSALCTLHFALCTLSVLPSPRLAPGSFPRPPGSPRRTSTPAAAPSAAATGCPAGVLPPCPGPAQCWPPRLPGRRYPPR